MSNQALLAFAAIISLSTTLANATTLDFEDISPQFPAEEYGGLSWSNSIAIAVPDPLDPSMNIHGVTSGIYAVAGLKDGPASFSSAAPFTLNGFDMTDPWGDGINVLTEGFLGGVHKFSRILTGFSIDPVAITLDWANIDEARFKAFLPDPNNPGGLGFERSFFLDDLRLNEPIASAPLPGSLAMLALALAGFGVFARRRAL
jgi:hypothetical protein